MKFLSCKNVVMIAIFFISCQGMENLPIAYYGLFNPYVLMEDLHQLSAQEMAKRYPLDHLQQAYAMQNEKHKKALSLTIRYLNPGFRWQHQRILTQASRDLQQANKDKSLLAHIITLKR